jgi:hypothetical protein
LLVNGKITFRRAMEISSDPEDLSLKLRKLFPQIEDAQRGGKMAFGQRLFGDHVQLMDVKHLYEEQEERWKTRLAEKNAEVAAIAEQLSKAEQNTGGAARPSRASKREICPAERGERARPARGPGQNPAAGTSASRSSTRKSWAPNRPKSRRAVSFKNSRGAKRCQVLPSPSEGVREGSPLASLQRRPWPQATSREASGRQAGVRV